MEEEAAEYAKGVDKADGRIHRRRSAPPGTKMGHAGAIVSAGRGSYCVKAAALEKGGVQVADIPGRFRNSCQRRPPSPASPEVNECAAAHRGRQRVEPRRRIGSVSSAARIGFAV